jgi:hemoglobin
MGSNAQYCSARDLRSGLPKPDLSNRADIETFVQAFYTRLLADPELAPLFLDVAAIDLDKHVPIICDYWQKLLFGDSSYQRHTMNKHRAVDAKHPFTKRHFELWTHYFMATMDSEFQGPMADKAKRIALRIAHNMSERLAEHHAAQHAT